MQEIAAAPLDGYAKAMIGVFIIGYAMITLEHWTRINKATVALLMAIVCWILQFANHNWHNDISMGFLGEHISSISQVVFFLLGALSIVEIINAHKGFNSIANLIRVKSKKQLLWMIGFVAFFLSGILDNLTTTVVMVSLLTKILDPGEDRLLIGGGIVIAANAGGAWTPIGDVTTTMLWIGGQVSTISIMKSLLLPSFVCVVVSLAVLSFWLKNESIYKKIDASDLAVEPGGNIILWLGILLLISVPIFKLTTGLPPFMGMLFALSILWLVTDIMHCNSPDRDHLQVQNVLTRIDLAGALFFLGILLCVSALDTAQILTKLAMWMDVHIGSVEWIATYIGLVSAVIDNVPLVAATMGMYDLAVYPTDHTLWQLIAFCAGTGGSILILGSAAGVVFMGMEKVDFIWYLKRISIPAFLGYIAGIGAYLIS